MSGVAANPRKMKSWMFDPVVYAWVSHGLSIAEVSYPPQGGKTEEGRAVALYGSSKPGKKYLSSCLIWRRCLVGYYQKL